MLVAEVHDTHHPIDVGLTYEDQRREAKKRAAAFVTARLLRFLGYFERILLRRAYLLGDALSYVDLSAFQMMCGLEYAFPRAMAALSPSTARLRDRVTARPHIKAYLASPRRLPFSEQGIFRHYPELDAGGGASYVLAALARHPATPTTTAPCRPWAEHGARMALAWRSRIPG